MYSSVEKHKFESEKYAASLFVCSFLTLMLVFTYRSDRYIYPILPVYYLLAAYAVYSMFKALRAQVHSHSYSVLPGNERTSLVANRGYISALVLVISWLTALLFAGSVIILPALPSTTITSSVSQLTGYSYHRRYPDYDGIGQYMQQHWRKGDIVISINPALCSVFYAGHSDY